MQYEMVKLMAHKAGALTIVGDPDQSIYGWRSAEVENLAYMTSGECDSMECASMLTHHPSRKYEADGADSLRVNRLQEHPPDLSGGELPFNVEHSGSSSSCGPARWVQDAIHHSRAALQVTLSTPADKERIDKSLRTSHPTGPPVVLRRFVNAQDEAAYIAYEIKRTIAQSGNTLNYNDFAILLRYNALSRAIEASLQSAGIPSRMVG